MFAKNTEWVYCTCCAKSYSQGWEIMEIFCAIGYAVSFPAMALGLPVGFINCLIFSTSSRADATRFSTVSLAWSTIVCAFRVISLDRDWISALDFSMISVDSFCTSSALNWR